MKRILFCLPFVFLCCPAFVGNFAFAQRAILPPMDPIAVPATPFFVPADENGNATVEAADDGLLKEPELGDAGANELLRKINIKTDSQEKLNAAQEVVNKENEAKRKLRLELARRFYDQRMAELARIKPKADPDFEKLGLNIFEFPELDGAESCQNLGMLIACRTQGIPYKWADRPDPDAAVDQNRSHNDYHRNDRISNRRVDSHMSYSTHLHSYINSERIRFSIKPDTENLSERTRTFYEENFGYFIGSNGAYMSIIGPPKPAEGETPRKPQSNYGFSLIPAEILIVDRMPSYQEYEAMNRAGIELEIRILGYDALVFVVNSRNPVSDIPLEMLKEMYSTNQGNHRPEANKNGFTWDEFGGPKQQVQIYDHQDNISFREALDKNLLEMEDGERRNVYLNSVSTGLSNFHDTFRNNPWGLGYSLYSWEHFAGAANTETKMLKVDGIAPSLENINARKYPVLAPIYVVTKKGIPADSRAARLRDWLLTTNGQRLVLECGYIPVKARD